ncbi:hypothetical protein HDV00_011149 [Rhizophlyctis rosea]|nr:hypothetical protein HDV00_011149 [Rhizophlyctis rosea]
MSAPDNYSDADSDSDVSAPASSRRRRAKNKKRKRRERPEPNYDDLFVFGYGSTLFRNDEVARSIEDGQMLMRWRDDEVADLTLDRYDVRNLLDNESQFYQRGPELSSDGHDSECEKERYLDIDSEEEKLFDMSEDERNAYVADKRKRRRWAEEDKLYAYNYDTSALLSQPQEEVREDYKPKYPAPDGVMLPRTERIAQIIEKTADFIRQSNNPQIEIMIQAKQAGNPDFSFLNIKDPCYPYFKHVLMLMRTGLFAYGGRDESEQEEEDAQEEVAQPETTQPGSSDQTPAAGQESERDGQILYDPAQTEAESRSALHQSTAGPDNQVVHDPTAPEATGMPLELQERIEKTARFVARNGNAFESKIKQKNAGDSKFAFLNPWNEHHAYYRAKVKEVQEGGTAAVTNGPNAANEPPVIAPPIVQPGDAASGAEVTSNLPVPSLNSEGIAPAGEDTLVTKTLESAKVERLQKAKQFLENLRARRTSVPSGPSKSKVGQSGDGKDGQQGMAAAAVIVK